MRTILLNSLLAIILMGCSGLSVLELQDAETLRPGKALAQAGGALAPDMMRLYYDSAATLGGLFVLIEEFGGRVGLAGHLDLSGSVWTSTTLLAPATSFQMADLGARFSLKWMISDRSAPERVAVSLGGWWYGATNVMMGDNSALRAYGALYGCSPSVIYGHVLGPADDTAMVSSSLYCGVRGLIYHADAHYGYLAQDSVPAHGVRDFSAWRAGYVIFAGYGRIDRGAIEASGLLTERLNGAGLTWSFYAGLRLPIGRQ